MTDMYYTYTLLSLDSGDTDTSCAHLLRFACVVPVRRERMKFPGCKATGSQMGGAFAEAQVGCASMMFPANRSKPQTIEEYCKRYDSSAMVVMVVVELSPILAVALAGMPAHGVVPSYQRILMVRRGNDTVNWSNRSKVLTYW